MENVYELDIDIKKENYINQPVLKQNDNAVFKLNILDDEKPIDLSNAVSITLANLRPDRKNIIIVGSLGDNENQVVFDISRPENSIVGTVEATVQFYGSENRISTATFTYRVEKDPSNISPSGTDKTLIELVLGEGPAVLKAAEEATTEALAAAELAQQESENLGQIKIDVVKSAQDAKSAGEEAVTATTDALQATTGANEATTNAQNVADNTGSVGPFLIDNLYKKNNIVEDDGSSWIALVDTQGNPLPVLPSKENNWWRLVAQKGATGEQGNSFTVNALGLLSERSNYDLEVEGFSYIATDVGELYFRQGASGWSDGIPFGKGAPGEKGKDGVTYYTWIKYADSDKGEGMSDTPEGKKYMGIAYNKPTANKSSVAADYAWSLTQGKKGDPGTTSWNGISDKPEEFPPEGHNHPIEQIEGLQAVLDEKAPNSHVTAKINEAEIHGMRVNESGNFEFFNGADWVESSGGSGGGGEELIATVNLFSNPGSMASFSPNGWKKVRMEFAGVGFSDNSSKSIVLYINGVTDSNAYLGYRQPPAGAMTVINSYAFQTSALTNGASMSGSIDVELLGGSESGFESGVIQASGTTTLTNNGQPAIGNADMHKGMLKQHRNLITLMVGLTGGGTLNRGIVRLWGVRK